MTIIAATDWMEWPVEQGVIDSAPDIVETSGMARSDIGRGNGVEDCS